MTLAPAAPAPVDTAAWKALAPALGLTLSDDDCGLQSTPLQAGAAPIGAGFVCALTDLGLLLASGDDARSFLHGQLTNDVEGLAPQEARWYGYCTAKGRLLSVFLGWRTPEGMALVSSRPMVEPLRKRLSMYVLRAKARLVDASESRLLLGLGGQAGAAALARLGLEAPAPMTCRQADDLSVVGLPAVALGGQPCPRWLLSVPVERVAEVWRTLTAGPDGATLQAWPAEAWRHTEVLAGVPRIVSGTAEQFVPQTLNLDLSGGVRFDKGCYPGQEVVARTHYLAKQRRRMHLARLNGPLPAAGSDVLDAAGAPVGRVALAARAPDGQVDLLFETRFEALEAGGLNLAGVPLQPSALPYPVTP